MLNEVRRPGAQVRPGTAAPAAWVLLIVVAFAWGWLARDSMPIDHLPPLHAGGRLLTWQLIPAVAVAAGGIFLLPRLMQALPWRRALIVAWAGSAVWAVALAVSDGVALGIIAPVARSLEYLAAVPAVGDDPIRFLSTFSERLASYPLHVKGHPPLPVLVLWCLDAVGLSGAGWAAGLLIVAGASSTAAVALTVKDVFGEGEARRILPFLVLAPLAIWVVTSMDAFFLAAGAWGAALTARAVTRDSVLLAVAAGLVLGSLPYLSYGLLALGAVPLAILILLRARAALFGGVVAGAVGVAVLITLLGFWWPDGVAATHAAYQVSGGSADRPYLYFLVGNFAVLALMTGPAVPLHLPPAGDRRLWLAGAALLGMIALAVSGFTKGEVERIWLPFAVWILVLADRPTRPLLAAQAGTAVAIQALTWSPW